MWRRKIYAIIETGGKQYKVSPEQTIEVERLPLKAGSTTVELDRVLLIADEDTVVVGNPTLKDARVIARLIGEKKGKKEIVFKYKRKVRYSRKRGHRQIQTTLAIQDIVYNKAIGDKE